jgi:hypothetical protein
VHRHRRSTGFIRVLELAVRSFGADLAPTGSLKQSDDVARIQAH